MANISAVGWSVHPADTNAAEEHFLMLCTLCVTIPGLLVSLWGYAIPCLLVSLWGYTITCLLVSLWGYAIPGLLVSLWGYAIPGLLVSLWGYAIPGLFVFLWGYAIPFLLMTMVLCHSLPAFSVGLYHSSGQAFGVRWARYAERAHKRKFCKIGGGSVHR